MTAALLSYAFGDATDLPATDRPIILAHVCNNVGAWGRGFTSSISRRWPEPEASYRALRKRLLGAIQLVWVQDRKICVINMIAQDGLPSRQRPVVIDYDALAYCLGLVATAATATNATVHMPRIGCGLAGGNWRTVQEIIERTLLKAGIAVTVYDLEKNP